MPPDSTICYLLRHAESEARQDLREAEWPLSPRGLRQAQGLSPRLARLGIGRIYSSPYLRALDTVRPFAEQARLDVTVLEDLRERKLCEGSVADFGAAVRRLWEDFALALPGGESSAACQRRVVAAVRGVARENTGATVLLSSHGNAIGLFLNALPGSRFAFEQWRAMPRPALYRIECRDGTFRLDQSFAWDLGGTGHEGEGGPQAGRRL